MSGKLHMVPAVINDDYVIRFAVCSVNASDGDIKYAWNVITETTSNLSSQSASLDLYRPDELVRSLTSYDMVECFMKLFLRVLYMMHQPPWS